MTFYRAHQATNAWKWFDYAVAEGTTNLNQRKNEFLQRLGPNPAGQQQQQQQLDSVKFWQQLKTELSSPTSIVQKLMCVDEPILAFLAASSSNLLKTGAA